jgi:hypothetical protein
VVDSRSLKSRRITAKRHTLPVPGHMLNFYKGKQAFWDEPQKNSHGLGGIKRSGHWQKKTERSQNAE